MLMWFSFQNSVKISQNFFFVSSVQQKILWGESRKIITKSEQHVQHTKPTSNAAKRKLPLTRTKARAGEENDRHPMQCSRARRVHKQLPLPHSTCLPREKDGNGERSVAKQISRGHAAQTKRHPAETLNSVTFCLHPHNDQIFLLSPT